MGNSLQDSPKNHGMSLKSTLDQFPSRFNDEGRWARLDLGVLIYVDLPLSHSLWQMIESDACTYFPLTKKPQFITAMTVSVQVKLRYSHN